MKIYCLLVLVAFFTLPAASKGLEALPFTTDIQKSIGQKKLLHLYTDVFNVKESSVLSLVQRAKDAGANGVLFGDRKTNFWWTTKYSDRFKSIVGRLRDGIRKMGMEFIIVGDGLGYCYGPISVDRNLAAGYPLQNVPLALLCGGTCLFPVQSVSILNGGFETSNLEIAKGWKQANPGETSFVDSAVSRSGRQSMRTEANVEKDARFSTVLRVATFQQYTLTFWVRALFLTTRFIAVRIRDVDTEIALTQQQLSMTRADGQRVYFQQAEEMSFPWTQMRISFNSLEARAIELTFGVWRGVSGAAWWDDISISSTPTLNLLRRASLPLSLRTADGRTLVEDVHFKRVVDPQLGTVGRTNRDTGSYDSYHDPPRISLLNNSNLSVRDVVTLNAYHAVPSHDGRVGCSWSDEKLVRHIEMSYLMNTNAFNPDGFLLYHKDAPHGGWEPAERSMKSAGEALVFYLRREIQFLNRIAPKADIYMWSEMIDRFDLATKSQRRIPFYKSLVDAQNGVNSKQVIIFSKGPSLGIETGTKSYAAFDKNGFSQIAVAFRNEDIEQNFKNWNDVIGGRKSAGSIYMTNQPTDFSEVEQFGALWWT